MTCKICRKDFDHQRYVVIATRDGSVPVNMHRDKPLKRDCLSTLLTDIVVEELLQSKENCFCGKIDERYENIIYFDFRDRYGYQTHYRELHKECLCTFLTDIVWNELARMMGLPNLNWNATAITDTTGQFTINVALNR